MQRRVKGKCEPTETTDAAKTEATNKDIKREISVEIPAAEVARETELADCAATRECAAAGVSRRARAGFHHQAALWRGPENDVIEALIPRILSPGS